MLKTLLPPKQNLSNQRLPLFMSLSSRAREQLCHTISEDEKCCFLPSTSRKTKDEGHLAKR